MGAALRKPKQSAMKLLQTKSLAYTIVKNVSGVQLPHTKAEKNKPENLDFVIFLSSSRSTQNYTTHMNILHVIRILSYWGGAISWLELHTSHEQ